MAHLCISYNILLNTPQIKKPCDFMIGALEPDSNKIKYDILNSRFLDRESVDVSLNKYITLSNMQEFISEESKNIKNLFYKEH